MTRTNVLILVVFSTLLMGSPTCCSAESVQPRLKSQLAKTATIHWQNVPLREALERLGDTMQIKWLLDRRIDPTQRIELNLQNDSLANGLDKLAIDRKISMLCYGETLYLGPTESVIALKRLSDASRTPASRSLSKKLSRRGSVEWQRLSEPRTIINELANEVGIKIQNPEAIPHDVWNQGSLSNQKFAERLDLLLIGFDLTWQITEGEIQIVPLDVATTESPSLSLAKQIESKRRRREAKSSNTKTEQLYTLQIREQPLNSVLRQIANQTGKELIIAQSATASSEQRISVSVKQVSLEELIEELCLAAGLQSKIDGNTIRVSE